MNANYKPTSCFYCNKTNQIFNKDHVIPKSKGGKLTVKTCFICNNKKSNYSLFEFYLIGGVSKELFDKTANFVKQTRPKKEYEHLFSFSCFENKIKLGHFQKIVNKNINNLNFNIEENEFDYIEQFKNLQHKFKNNKKTFFKLSDYFIYLENTNFNLTTDRLLHFRKILKNRTSISDELINNIIAINSNYFQIISKILNPKLKENLTESFMNKFFSFYNEQYLKSTILSIKLGIEQLDKKTLINSKNYNNNNYSEACS